MVLADLSIAFPDAQAGGGGAFGSGGGGGGGGGDWGGIFELLFWLLRLAFEVPVLGVPLLALGFVVFLVGVHRGWWRAQERTIARARPARRVHRSATTAAALRERDPDFDEARFLQRVERAFQVAQESWCRQDLEPLRPFVSDGVFERFALQIEEQREDGWRQGMKLTGVGPLAIRHVEPGRHFDLVTVRIPFRADIHRLSLESGGQLAGSRIPREEFVECWTFVRRRGAKTVARDGLIEGQCPNCGAPLRINQSARCGTCECLARSGEFDWVLTEITQASEWRPEREADVPGLAACARRDAGLSAQLLEDRASVAFWRKCAADRAGDVAPLRRVANEAFCRRYVERLAAATGAREHDADCAVGSVRLAGVLAGEERDRALVEVVWDGRRARFDAKGARQLDPQRRLRRTLLVFARAAGQSTPLEQALTTAHCGTCGAHDVGGSDPSCPYCGAPRSGDAATWLVEELLPCGGPRARRLLEAARAGAKTQARSTAPTSGRSATDLLAWAAQVVRADGGVSLSERWALDALGARLEVPGGRIEELLGGALDGAVPVPDDAGEARTWIGELTTIALSDGHLERRERRVLRRAAERMGLDPSVVERDLRASRAALFRDSRAARRHARGAAR